MLETGEKLYPYLVKVADIPIVEVDAAIELLYLSQKHDVRAKLLDRNNPPSAHDYARYQETINDKHPRALMWRNASSANFQAALWHAVKYVVLTEQDRTMDKPTTYDCEMVRQILESNEYCVNTHDDAGINCVKTAQKQHTNGLMFSLKVYDKNIESLQVAGKVKDRSVSNKFDKCVLPTTLGQQRRSANRKFQDHGYARIEGNFRGVGWTSQEMDTLIDDLAQMLIPAMRVCSFHDKLLLTERKIKGITAVHCPDTFQWKLERMEKEKDTDPNEKAKTRSLLGTVPETVVEYYSNSLTGQVIGRTISSPIDGRRRDMNGFESTVAWLANEAPCNTEVSILVLVRGFRDYMRGELPVLAFRLIQGNKYSEQLPGFMNVAVMNHAVDVMNSCGINVSSLNKLRFNFTTSLDFSTSGLDLTFSQAAVVAADRNIHTRPRPYEIYETIPTEFWEISIEKYPYRGDRLVFDLRGTLFAIPHAIASEMELVLAPIQGTLDGIYVRRTPDFGLHFKTRDGMMICEKAHTILPTQSEPIEILKFCRKPHVRTHTFEFILKNEGRFKAPITVSKQFFTHLITDGTANDGNDAIEISLIGRGYFIIHNVQECCYVKNGNHPEEMITFIRMVDGQHEVIAKQERTNKRRK